MSVKFQCVYQDFTVIYYLRDKVNLTPVICIKKRSALWNEYHLKPRPKGNGTG
jgi:hypothetical protein